MLTDQDGRCRCSLSISFPPVEALCEPRSLFAERVNTRWSLNWSSPTLLELGYLNWWWLVVPPACSFVSKLFMCWGRWVLEPRAAVMRSVAGLFSRYP